MAIYRLGDLVAVPIEERPELLPPVVATALRQAGIADRVGVVEIDPGLSDTAATAQAYRIPTDALVNCVVVAGKRQGVEAIAACVIPATKRVDVNGVVRRRLDVRKASFLQRERAVELTGMEYGGITPIGLPWPVLVDTDVVGVRVALIGSGVRGSKLLLPGALLAALPRASAIPNLGLARESSAPLAAIEST